MLEDTLLTYLADHLAASTAAVELLHHLKEAADEKRALEIESLTAEIEKDREVLRAFLHDAGGEESMMKKAGAWAAEKLALGKFKMNDINAGSLGELEALEMLSLGIEGKACLWKALSVVSVGEGLDLQGLLWRGERQREIVETWRIAKVRQLFC